jgi:ketosteroid isomerase-like protein
MKKKNVFNIMLFVFILIFFCIICCTKSSKVPTTDILLQTDRDFSATSVREGMHKAFLMYFADDGVLLRNNSYPLRGKRSLEALFANGTDSSFTLSWEPVFEKLSASRDLGYTYGIFTNKDKFTGKISKGTYVTIWIKQRDGNWKFVLDTGTQGLPEI